MTIFFLLLCCTTIPPASLKCFPFQLIDERNIHLFIYVTKHKFTFVLDLNWWGLFLIEIFVFNRKYKIFAKNYLPSPIKRFHTHTRNTHIRKHTLPRVTQTVTTTTPILTALFALWVYIVNGFLENMLSMWLCLYFENSKVYVWNFWRDMVSNKFSNFL